jgi:succinate dehydrogenase / fumarate reductase iron-sulfur subunit
MNPIDTARSHPRAERPAQHRLLQHHQVLHQGVPGAHHITDNAIIPLKERVVDRFYDPVSRLLRMVTGK